MKYVIPKDTWVWCRTDEISEWDMYQTPIPLKYSSDERIAVGARSSDKSYYEFKLPPNERNYTALCVFKENVIQEL